MLPQFMFNPFMNPQQMNLQTFLMLQQLIVRGPQKEMMDKACQFPEHFSQTIEMEPNNVSNPEELILNELSAFLHYLSKNISLLKDHQFDSFVSEHMQYVSSLNKDINLPNTIKKRYIQVNKTKEEMTKFIIRRAFLFIKSHIKYVDKEGLQAEERDRLFYNTFFESDEEFMKNLNELNLSIDDLIPFRKDSKMKTMNEAYLKRLFQSKKFSELYIHFLDQFNDICMQENEDKVENMTKQLVKIIHTREFSKIKTYRRFPWKDHELNKCKERAQELFNKYRNADCSNQKAISKHQSLIEKCEHTDKSEEICPA